MGTNTAYSPVAEQKNALSEQPKTKRVQFASKLDFILICIGYCVGLGNIWRFPYLCYKNGGGAFLVPYLTVMVICGLPLAALEQCVGQYVGLGAITFWKLCPAFKGVGYAYSILNTYICIYYIVVIVYAIHYLFSTFTKHLPWESCNNEWNTKYCFEFLLNAKDQHQRNQTGNITEVVYKNMTLGAGYNIIQSTNGTANNSLVSPSEEYFMRKVLNISDGVEHIGDLQWQLAVCLVGAWAIVYFSTIKSIRSGGKVAYLTATFPYIMLTILVIRGFLLPGSLSGVIYYLKPDVWKLLDPEVWFSASLQIFFSIGPGYGIFITMSSYNKFKNNCIRDATITVLMNCGTSIYAGLAVFTVLGAMANELGISVDDVVQSGPGLAFVAYPRALLTMPLPQLWTALFFFMLILLGVSSELCHFETVLSALADEIPRLRATWPRALLGVFAAIIMSCIGLIFTTQGGMYYFAIADTYSTGIGLMLVALLECIIFTWIYGMDRLSANIKSMMGYRPNWYFKICWKFLCPIMVLIVLGVSLGVWKPATMGDYEYPPAANAVGWAIACLPLTPILAHFIYSYATNDEPNKVQRLKKILSPSDDFEEHIRQRMLRDLEFEKDIELLTIN